VSPLVLALVLSAAVAHATWNVTMKRVGASGPTFLWLTFLIGVVVFLPFGVWSLIDSGVDLAHWALLATVSGLLQVGYFFLVQKGYRAADVSVVYPLARGTGPVLSVVLAIILLGERPGPSTLLGAAVVVMGVGIIGFAGDRSARRSMLPGVLFGLAIGGVIAVYTLWDSAAVTVWGMPVVGLYWGSVVVQGLVLAPAALRDRVVFLSALNSHWRAALIVGVLAPLAYILVLLAIQQAPVSVVAPAREVSVVLVGLAGWLLFKEPHPVQRMIGAGVVLGGVALLALPL
jgi:drug/metabolite transporter (DMT)-like permease